MSELQPQDDELPSIRLNLAGTEFDATPENASLYMHLGRLSIYNHVYLEQGAGEALETRRGTYLFASGEWFEELSQFMAGNGYQMHVNLRSVTQGDLKAYNMMIEQQIGDIDEVPEWLSNGQ